MGKRPERRISASGIKAFEDCTWKYWNQTIKRLPDKGNDGAIRGTICHLVLQTLLDDRHKFMVEPIIKGETIEIFPSIPRLVIKHLKKKGILNTENYRMIDSMILVALKNDFFCDGGDLLPPEFRFDIINDDPIFVAKGFIDKLAFYKKGSIARIIDYKTSKMKFSGEEKVANTQAFLYSWAIKKLFKDVKHVSVEFLFLRFAQAPRQIIEPTDAQLSGFIHYVGYINEQIQKLTEDTAKMNFAANNKKKRWLCSAGKWICPFKNEFSYYAILDKYGNITSASRDKADLDPKKGKIHKLFYQGCPAFKNSGGL